MYDVHSHYIPSQMLDWFQSNAQAVNATWESRVPGKEPFLAVNGKWAFELKKEFVDKNLYFLAQDEVGITYSLVSPIPQLFLYDFDSDLTQEAARVYNAALAELVRQHQHRMSALATLPLNAPEAAVKELERSLANGLKGAIIGPGLDGKLLSDEVFEPIWEEANHKRAILFIHPLLNEDKRIQRNRMPNLIGVPWETTLCALDLILSGHFDKYPDVKVLLAHGGGFLPYQIGRYTKGYEVWPQVRASLQASPEEYLRRMYYDNVLWNDTALAFLESVVGKDRVLSGTDFPFDLTTWPPADCNHAVCRTFLGLQH